MHTLFMFSSQILYNYPPLEEPFLDSTESPGIEEIEFG